MACRALPASAHHARPYILFRQRAPDLAALLERAAHLFLISRRCSVQQSTALHPLCSAHNCHPRTQASSCSSSPARPSTRACWRRPRLFARGSLAPPSPAPPLRQQTAPHPSAPAAAPTTARCDTPSASPCCLCCAAQALCGVGCNRHPSADVQSAPCRLASQCPALRPPSNSSWSCPRAPHTAQRARPAACTRRSRCPSQAPSTSRSRCRGGRPPRTHWWPPLRARCRSSGCALRALRCGTRTA